MIIEIWILIALIHYGIKTKKWRDLRKGNADKLTSGAIYTTLLPCAGFNIVYAIITLIYITLGFNLGEDELCDALGDAVISVYALILLAVHTLLWLRQRSFYSNKMLNASYGKRIKFFSGFSIIILYTAGIGVLVFNAYPDDHVSSLDGCVYTPDDSFRVAYWVTVVIAVAFGQSTLLGLFIYALIQARNQTETSCLQLMKDSCCCFQTIPVQLKTPRNERHVFIFASQISSTSNSTTIQTSHKSSRARRSKLVSGSESSNVDKIKRILWKTLTFSIITVLSPLFIQIFVHYIVDPDGHRRFAVVVGNINAILNLLLLVAIWINYVMNKYLDEKRR